MDELEKTTRMNDLLDIYGNLLTEKQYSYLEEYFRNDLSFGEIADIYNVSRNAVYDQIKRATHVLEEYEEKLGLLEKHNQRLALIASIEEDENQDHSQLVTYLERLKEL